MKISNVVIATSFVWLVISFWNRDNLPRNVELLPAVASEPRQTPTDRLSFTTSFNEIAYEIEPEFDYELHGMVVSYRHHEGDSRMHFLSRDHLNMLDVCVVWGDNASNPLIHKLDFWNGIFTCVVKTRDQEAWESFDMYQLSNNHLISDDQYIRDQVKDLQIGDQIRVRGFLASYGSEGGGKRGTSTTRLDTGDGACETLYVEDFKVVRAARSNWRISMYASLVILLAGLFVHFKRPYRPYKED